MNLAEPTWLGLVNLLAVTVLAAGASAFLAGVLVEDDVTEPFREWVWGPPERPRFPYAGRGLPLELDGRPAQDSPGTLIGALLLCVRCVGAHTTWLILGAYWLAYSPPGGTIPQTIVACVLQYGATCQLQRWLNKLTARSLRR